MGVGTGLLAAVAVVCLAGTLAAAIRVLAAHGAVPRSKYGSR